MAASGSKAKQWEQYSDGEEDAGAGDSASGSGSSDGGAVSNSDDEGEERRPTYAQFEGESDLEADDSEEDEESGSEASSADDDDAADSEDDAMEREAQLRKQMASVPFGALVKARSKMAAAGPDDEDLLEEDEWAEERAKAASRSRPSSSASSDDKRKQVKDQLAAMRGKKAATDDELERRPRRDRDSIPSRNNKHAPQEVSSRRPVSRKRNVVDAPSSSSSNSLRDPRFSNLSGPSVNAGLFSKSYSFLSDARTTELSTLKQTLSKLRKLEANHAGPKASSDEALKIREERANVEQALKREEAKEAERMRRQREGEVMRKFKRENEERVKNGGKAFYLKESAKREMMLQDKFARLAGGNRRGREGEGEASGSAPPAASSSKALRKALDKRRKRNVQRERKALPFLDTGRRSAGGGGGGGGGGGSGDGRSRDGPPAKRKRGSRGGGSK